MHKVYEIGRALIRLHNSMCHSTAMSKEDEDVDDDDDENEKTKRRRSSSSHRNNGQTTSYKAKIL